MPDFNSLKALYQQTNFNETSKSLLVELNKAGLPSGSKVKVCEFWSSESLGEFKTSFKMELKPHSCKVFLLEA